MTDSGSEGVNMVWVFTGWRSGSPAGVFSSLAAAECWIQRHELSDTLSELPLDVGVYDHAIANELFVPKKEHETSSDFIADFSSRLDHFHYEDGIR